MAASVDHRTVVIPNPRATGVNDTMGNNSNLIAANKLTGRRAYPKMLVTVHIEMAVDCCVIRLRIIVILMHPKSPNPYMYPNWIFPDSNNSPPNNRARARGPYKSAS